MDKTSEIEKILDRLHIEFKLVGDNFMISCPLHSDDNPSFGIRRDGVWNCFSCNESGGWKDLSRLLGFKTKKLSFDEVIQEKLRQSNKKTKQMKSTKLPYDFVEYGKNPPANVLERVSLELIEKYGIGEATSTFPRYFIIPVKVNGYNSYVCRHRIRNPSNNIRRWRLAEGFSKVLFPNPTKEVIIVEGLLDAFAIEDFGFSASTCFGHSLSDIQVSQLMTAGVENIVLLFDSYEAHYMSSIKTVFKLLLPFFSVSAMKLDRDADEVDREEFVDAYERRIYLSDELDRIQLKNFREEVLMGMNGG